MSARIEKTNMGIVLKTPFNREFVDDLKAQIPSSERRWDSYHKAWGVSAAYAEKAIELFECYFGDEDARINEEIEQIKKNQAVIIAQEDKINEAIIALDDSISHYSFQSSSSIKGRMCRDRALLAHSIDNASIPVEKLTELQVCGLAAAVRLIRDKSIWQMTSRQ